jgi:hypothetical protein
MTISLASCPFPLHPAYITDPIPHPTHFNPDDGGNMFLWNISIRLQGYTVSQPQSEQSPPSKSQNLWNLSYLFTFSKNNICVYV